MRRAVVGVMFVIRPECLVRSSGFNARRVSRLVKLLGKLLSTVQGAHQRVLRLPPRPDTAELAGSLNAERRPSSIHQQAMVRRGGYPALHQ
jgi:hypothetical protein